jgi:hypothetical protein
VIIPVSGSQVNPSGRFITSYLIGFVPVTGIVKRNGEPGLTPKTLAPLIRGAGADGGVRITFSSIAPAPGVMEHDKKDKINNPQIGIDNKNILFINFI